MKHIFIGVAASFGLSMVIVTVIAIVLFISMEPGLFSLFTAIVLFGVAVGIIDWYSERKSRG